MTGSPSWRDTPVEFVGVPAGCVVPERLIAELLGPQACLDCIPLGYSLHYTLPPLGTATDLGAWTVVVTHADPCPRLWLLRQRADGAM